MAVSRRVGLLAALRPGIGTAELSAAAGIIGSAPLAIKSPWAGPANLHTVVWSDIFGKLPIRPLNRAEAMRLPEVARSRHIVAGTLARIEMRAYRGETPLTGPDAPPWIASTAGDMSPFHRMLMTVDDLLFYGWSLWRRTENTADGRFPLKMDRVPMGQWSLEPDTGRVLIHKPDPLNYGATTLQPARRGEVVLIPGPHEGLLVDGADTLRHTADLHRAANRAARHPSAYIGLKLQPGAAPLKRESSDPTEVTARTVVTDWVAAREAEDGGVAYLGGLDAVELGTFDQHLVVEGRNAAAIDVARHASIPGDLIDATMTNSSLQYSTSRDNDRRSIDYGLGLYMGAISGRMTQDDVTAHGQRIAFDLEEWLQGDGAAPGQPATSTPPGLSPAPTPSTGEPPQ